MTKKSATFVDRLREGLSLRRMTQAELSRRTGLDKSSVSRYLGGEYKAKQDAVYKIAQALNVAEGWLMGYDVPMEVQSTNRPPRVADAHEYRPTRIPVLGRISAGLPLYAEENIEGYVYTELNHGGEYFALRIKGDSMNAANIITGQIVVVRRQDIVENGEVAVVLVGDDEATVKRFYRDGDIVTLMPQSTNPAHIPQVYNLKNTQIHVLGKVVQSVIAF